jgi:hypothetical protein
VDECVALLPLPRPRLVVLWGRDVIEHHNVVCREALWYVLNKSGFDGCRKKDC